MSASHHSTPRPGRSGEEDGRAGAAPAGSRLAAALLVAGAAGFLAVLALSVWLGVRFGFARVPRLEVVIEGPVPATVELLSALLEGASGVLALGAASAGLLARGCGVFSERPTGRSVARRLRRLWRDLLRLSRDAARWVRELPRRRGAWHASALAVVVAVGAALRLLYLSQPVRYDEAFTFTHFASEPVALGLSRYTFPNNHLLHTLLVRLVTSVFGTAPAVMRLPAFLAGVGVVPAAYAAWDALGDADEALVAASVAAVSTPLVLYSTNARGYTLVVLGGLLLVPLAARLLRYRDLAAWALLCVVSAASLHAIPIALYPVGAALFWLVLSGRSGNDEAAAEPLPGGGEARSGGGTRRRRPELLRESGAALLVIGVAAGWLYMPAIQLSGLPSIVANRFVAPSPVGEFAAGLPGFFATVWSTWTTGWPTAAAVALGVLAVIGVGREVGLPGGSGRGPGAASYPVAALAWSVLLLLLGRRVPFARVWLFLVPVFGLLVARGAGWVLGWSRAGGGATAGGDGDGVVRTVRRTVGGRVAGPAAALLLLVGLGGPVVARDAVVESPATNPYRDGEEVARLLQERMEEEDGLLALGPAEVVLEYWFQHLGMSPDRVNLRPDPGGRLYLVVHDAEGQTLPGMMAKLGVAGSRRTRSRQVAELEHSTLYALLPPEDTEGSARGTGGRRAGAPGRPRRVGSEDGPSQLHQPDPRRRRRGVDQQVVTGGPLAHPLHAVLPEPVGVHAREQPRLQGPVAGQAGGRAHGGPAEVVAGFHRPAPVPGQALEIGGGGPEGVRHVPDGPGGTPVLAVLPRVQVDEVDQPGVDVLPRRHPSEALPHVGPPVDGPHRLRGRHGVDARLSVPVPTVPVLGRRGGGERREDQSGGHHGHRDAERLPCRICADGRVQPEHAPCQLERS